MSITPRVLMISSQHNVFDGRIFHLEAKTLHDHGFKVTILAPGKNDSSGTEDGIDFRTFRKFPSGLRRKCGTVRSLWNIANRIPADILHVHEVDVPLLVAAELKRRRNRNGQSVRLIFDSHEVWPYFYARYAKNRVCSTLVRHAVTAYESWMLGRSVDGVITAHEMEENYYRWLNPWIPVRKVLGGAPMDEWPEPEKREGAIRIIGHDGYFTLQRGMKVILRGFAQVARDHPEVILLIAGDFQYPEDKAYFEKWKSMTGLGDRVEWTGWVDRANIRQYLDRMDIGIIANKLDMHSIRCFPANKFMYYLARGVPVLSTPSPLYHEFIQQHEVGEVMSKLTPKAFRQAANRLIQDPGRTRKMGWDGFHLAKQKFNWTDSAKNLLDLYEEVLKSS